MIRVMIVEDEPPINRLLQSMIAACGDDYQIISAVYDGQEALEVFPETLPDVLFTDIKMPGIDGLELVRRVRISHPDLLTVILTGYGDYENVHTALQQQVFDYLLKPISRPVMEDLLRRLKEKCQAVRQDKILRYFSQSIHNQFPGREIQLQYRSFVVAAACAGSFPCSQIRSYAIPEGFWSQQACRRLLGCDLYGLPGATPSEYMFILGLNEQDPSSIRRILTALYDSFPKTHPVTLLCSKPIPSTGDVGLELGLLRNMMVLYVRIGEGQLYLYCDFQNKPDFNQEPVDLNRQQLLLHYVDENDFPQFSAHLTDQFREFSMNHASQFMIARTLKQLVQRMERNIADKNSFDHYYSELLVDEAIVNSLSLAELQRNYLCICEDIFKIVERSRTHTDGLRDLVSEVAHYLEQNYNQPITNQTLEQHFLFSSSYLCQLFKKYKGVSPNKYLLKLRARRACELIQRDPGITAKVIAELLGISDPLYFYKFFKNETGYTLSEYKTLVQSGQS